VTTQDLAGLVPGEGAYGALTDDRGRPVSDFFLYVLPEALLLEAPLDSARELRAALERLIIADDVVLAWAGNTITVREADSAQALSAMMLQHRSADVGYLPPVEALDDRRPGVLWGAGGNEPEAGPLDESALASLPRRRQVVLRASRFGRFGELDWNEPVLSGRCLGRLHPMAGSGFHAREIRAFRPGPTEFAEARVWNELDRMDAVSFSKGCFMGQEILNRVQSRGQLQRKLVTLALDNPAPYGPIIWNGVELVAPDGQPAGVITRAAEDVAFAFVRRPHWEPGTRLVARLPGIEVGALGVTVRPRLSMEVP